MLIASSVLAVGAILGGIAVVFAFGGYLLRSWWLVIVTTLSVALCAGVIAVSPEEEGSDTRLAATVYLFLTAAASIGSVIGVPIGRTAARRRERAR